MGVLAMRSLANGGGQSVLAAENCSAKSLVGSYSLQIWDKFVDVKSGNPT